MKAIRVLVGIVVAVALAAGAWILLFHSDWLKGAHDEDEDAAEVMAEVPVKVGKITRATLRRYVEGYGTVEAQPLQGGSPAASARVASPVAGIVADVLCSQGQQVQKGALLFQLDERSVEAEEEKAVAALASAQASLDKLKSFPRPDQIKVAEMQVDRARRAAEFSLKKHTRLAQLAADQLAPEKTLLEAELELLGAQNDLAVADKQLLLLRSTPTKEEVAEAQGKVVEAQKSLATAQVQRSLLKIQAPLSGTIVRTRVNPGEAVDLTTILAEVVDLDRLVVEGTVPAAGLRSVTVGMDVDLRTGGEASKAASPGPEPLKGKVVFVGLDIDRKSDAGFVRVALPPKAGVPPGQFVCLRIVVEEQKNHLAVPRESVVRNPEGKDVIVGFLGEKAVMKEVRVGLREGDLVGIEGGEVDEGDVVVTQGAYGLPGEAKVRIIKDK
ncbi:MAG: efflux RND transporter periplasmic adaptor subunit [Planctomycetes bacterium]|nr:efflux RND transporter periplasmic adaptor subunit [Planctomycetota bacterium]